MIFETPPICPIYYPRFQPSPGILKVTVLTPLGLAISTCEYCVFNRNSLYVKQVNGSTLCFLWGEIGKRAETYSCIISNSGFHSIRRDTTVTKLGELRMLIENICV